MMKWQLIETAPIDRPIIGFCPDEWEDERILMIQWHDDYGYWQIHIDSQRVKPTHWMERPLPPDNF